MEIYIYIAIAWVIVAVIGAVFVANDFATSDSLASYGLVIIWPISLAVLIIVAVVKALISLVMYAVSLGE